MAEQEEDDLMTTEEILAMDFTPTQAMNFMYNGLQVAIESGNVFDEGDTKILLKAIETFTNAYDTGEDIVIKVKE